MKLFLLFFFLASSVMAQVEGASAINRERSSGSVMGGYQILNTWVPGKVTGSYTYIFNQIVSLEVEYANSEDERETAGAEIGTIDENRYTLMFKYYWGNSFYVSLGPYINELSIDLSDDIRTGAGITSHEELEISSLGASLGIGNRWQYDNGFTVGIDWVRLNQPTGTIKTETSALKDLTPEDKDDVKRTGKIIRTMPAFTYFGLSIGYSF